MFCFVLKFGSIPCLGSLLNTCGCGSHVHVFFGRSRAKVLRKSRDVGDAETICAGEVAGKEPWFWDGGGLGLDYDDLFSVFL